MEAKELVTGILSGITRPLNIAMEGITEEQLTYRPHEHSNSIGWLVWHLTRVQDRIVSGLQAKPQSWVSEGWHEKFGRPADEGDAGMGHGADQVAGLKASPQLLMDHYNAILRRTEAYVNSLSPADLDRVVDASNPEVTVGRRLQVCIMDNVQHAGQAAYLRGLIEGRKVWPS